MDRFQRSQAAHAKAKRDCALWRWLRWILVGLMLALPGVAAAACSGEPGDVGKAGETYTLGDGTIVSCEGLLIVSEGMLRSVVAYGGNGSFVFLGGGVYDGVALVSGSYTMSQIYTGNITNMSGIFRKSYDDVATRQDISKWDTSNVTNMSHMFDLSTAFNGNIGQWDTSKVTDFSHMFENAQAFNADIGDWNTSRATNMAAMFKSAIVFDKDITRWDTSSVSNMDLMFYFALSFNKAIGTWNTAKVINMGGMFHDARAFAQDLSGWNVCGVTNHTNFELHSGIEGTYQYHPHFPPFGVCAGGDREIDVSETGGASIASGGALSLGNVGAPGAAKTLVLTVQNTGFDALSLGNVYTSGLSNVSIQSAVLGATSVAGGGSTTLTVSYTPTALGDFSFTLAITNNDPDEGSYIVVVSGSVGVTALRHEQILASGAQAINDQVARHLQSHVSNRFAQAKGGNGRVFQNNLSQFQDQASAERAPGDAVALSTELASATTDPSEALAQIGQALGFVDADGWVSVTTDDLMLAATQLSGFQSAAQVAQLDPGLAASLGAWDKAGAPFDGLLPGDGLDFYAAYSGGAYYKKGQEAYVGSTRDLTLGLDGFVTSDLFMGLALGHEASEIKFEGTLAGKLAQQGWRADAYAAWQAFDAFNLEGLVSYAGFANTLTGYVETGRPDSQRWIASGKASLELDWDRYTLSPYGSINYSHETFDAYITNLGTAVAKVGVEQGQWSTGLRVQGHQPVIYGLTGYASAAANGTWLNRDTVTGALPLDVLDEDQVTAAWGVGLTGSLAGLAEGSWLGDVLASADASLTYGQNGIFGANRASRWSIGLAWQY